MSNITQLKAPAAELIHPFYTPICDVKIVTAQISENGLQVVFSDQDAPQLYSWFWVRDHGVDRASIDYTTLQRQIDTFALAADIVAERVELDVAQQLIDVTWSDGASSTISAYMLLHVIGRAPARHQLVPQQARILWDKESPLEETPTVHYEQVMATNEGLRDWLEKIHVYGFCVVMDVPANEQATTELAQRVGKVQETLFGGMWKLSSELVDHGDTAYSTQYLEPHTDGTYYHEAAGLQMFNCLEFDGKGGESVQVDGFALAARIKRDHPAAYQTLTEIAVPGHYIEPDVHMHAERPAFQLDASGQIRQVSFNNYDRAPMLLPPEQSKRFHEAYKLFHDYANDQSNWVKIALRPGMTLIFDNWRNLHGRMGYVGKRVFYGCYHSKAEFESKLRVMQLG